MQQQPPSMIPVMSSYPPSNITTEQIQKYLDENKKLILAILDNQNLGKLTECAQYQAQLQKNLMYLAAIADAQPPTPTIPTPPQMAPPHHAMQQAGGGGFYVQHPQAAAMAHQQHQQQQAMKMPLQFNTAMHQLQDPHHQAQMAAAMRPGGGGPPVSSNGMHGGGPPQSSGSNKQDEPGTDGGDGSEEGK